MFKRILTGIVIFFVVAGAIASRFLHPLIFDLFVLLVAVFSAMELVKAYRRAGKRMFDFLILVFPAVVWVCYFFASKISDAILFQILALLGIFVVCIAIEIILPKTKKGKELISKNPEIYANSNLLDATFRTLSFLIYPTLLVGTLFGINLFDVKTGFVALLLVFGVSSFTDTFAFFFGIALKGKRLCPEISPKKGIPGMIFGAVGGVFASFLVMWLFYFENILPSAVSSLSLASAIVMFSIVGIFGTFLTQFGDLFESALKRRLNIKDFGNIFPGHGGFLDRIDGQMFCSCLVFVCFLIFL